MSIVSRTECVASSRRQQTNPAAFVRGIVCGGGCLSDSDQVVCLSLALKDSLTLQSQILGWDGKSDSDDDRFSTYYSTC